jgi:hypothetical protein
MYTYAIGFGISLFVLIVLWGLFRHEERTGVRFAAHARTRADYLLLRITHSIHQTIDMFGRDSMRQVFHYLLHTFLKGFLALNKRWEQSLRDMMRVNKMLAKNADKERTTRNKLEEIAIHKVESALTDKEKQVHKDRSLRG